MTIDAMAFLKPTTQGERPLLEWLNQEDVMVYADPSYIKPDDEDEALEGVDWEHEGNLTEAIILNRYIKNRMVEFRKRYIKNKSGVLKGKADTYEQAIQKRCRKILATEYAELKKRGNFKFDLPRNLGSIYAASFSYAEHENFLKCIKDCKCKMMVSNYDLVLYNKYLKDWRRDEFITTTSIGMQKDNVRVEVVWYNY